MAVPRIPAPEELYNLRQSLWYDAKTGMVRSRPKNGRAGYDAGNGYHRVTVSGRRYMLHRVVWFLVTEAWPLRDIDHINGIPSDNRIENLRECSKRLNAQNKHGPLRNSKTGVLGVTLCKQTGLYRAQIMAGGKSHWIGRYPTIEEARIARLRAKKAFHEAGRL